MSGIRNSNEKRILMKQLAAEFLGIYILMFCGTGAAIVNVVHNGVITHLGVAISFGLVVMAMIYTFGDKSGAHINPAVTIAFAVQKVFPARKVLPYILAQLAGALAASVTLKFLFPQSVTLGATLPAGSQMQSLILEFLLTFFLMLTIVHVAEGGKEKGLFAGIAIGSVILIEALFAGPVSGASMNPARSIAPAVVSGNLAALWIYILAPVAGALFAIFVHRILK
jgi:aquaporin Z